MKSTRAILKGNEDLLENEVVNKLIEYKQLLNKNKENILVKEKRVNHKEVLLRFNENLNQFFLYNNI